MIKLCSICQSSHIQTTKKIQSPYFDHKFTLFFCKECKSYFFDPVEHNVNLEKLYNSEQQNWNLKFNYSKYWDRQVCRINNLLTNKKNQLNILDIGCRTGDFLLHWSKKHNLHGVELNKNNASIAKQRNLNIYNNFIENVNFELKFDVITCYALLEHIASPQQVLEKIGQLLNNHGILVIMIPSIESEIRKKLDKKNIHWHMYSPPQHLSFYSRKYLDEFMSKRDINLCYRYFTQGGLNGRYSKNSNTYKLLANTDYTKLNEYFFSQHPIVSVEEKSNILKNIQSKFVYYKRLIFDEYSPTNRIPYYDHIYSYYQKKY